VPTSRSHRPVIVLVVVLTAAFAINLDTTIVNVALPALNRQLGAGTASLQWVVDGYNLAFAALVLAGGNLGDRWPPAPSPVARSWATSGGGRCSWRSSRSPSLP